MPRKSFALIWENDTAQIVCTDPDFELTAVCRTPDSLKDEARRLQDELQEVIREGHRKMQEYVKSPRLYGFKTWEEYHAAKKKNEG